MQISNAVEHLINRHYVEDSALYNNKSAKYHGSSMYSICTIENSDSAHLAVGPTMGQLLHR